MPGDANPAPAYKFSATVERTQKFERCKLVATATAVGDRYLNERCTGPVRVKVKTALPPTIDSVRVLLDVKGLLEKEERNLTGIEHLPVIFWGAISFEREGVAKCIPDTSLLKGGLSKGHKAMSLGKKTRTQEINSGGVKGGTFV